MNFKMISDIMLALVVGKCVGISKNVGTQFEKVLERLEQPITNLLYEKK